MATVTKCLMNMSDPIKCGQLVCDRDAIVLGEWADGTQLYLCSFHLQKSETVARATGLYFVYDSLKKEKEDGSKTLGTDR